MLADTFRAKAEALLLHPRAKAFQFTDNLVFLDWICEHFNVHGRSKSKKLQHLLYEFWFLLSQQESIKSCRDAWNDLAPQLDRVVVELARPKSSPYSKRVGNILYLNQIGASQGYFDQLIEEVELHLNALKGWRSPIRHADLRLVFSRQQDIVFDEPLGDADGSFDAGYGELRITSTVHSKVRKLPVWVHILYHELGHAWLSHYHSPEDFDRACWYTTAYSPTEGEAFPELFAAYPTEHYPMKDVLNPWRHKEAFTWDFEVNQKFEALMEQEMTQKMAELYSKR